MYQKAFTVAALPYFNPHRFHDAILLLGQRLCTIAERLKAWSQNIWHEGVMSTMISYGKVLVTKQAETIRIYQAGT
jgi:integrase/recombinase XerD